MNFKNLIVLIAILTLLTSSAVAQNKYALLVGISNYQALNKGNEWDNIHGVNDVSLISQELKKQNFQVDTLHDVQATKANIIWGLQRLSKSVTQGSIVYIHFSMHGQPFDDELSMVKKDEAWDESLVPIDAMITYDEKYKGENHLVDDELNTHTDAIRSKIGQSGMLYVVVDACHAGEMSRDFGDITRGTKRGFTNDTQKRFRATSERPSYFTVSTKSGQSPVIYLEACQGKEVNREMKFNGKYYGPMSYFIWQTISNKKIGKDTSWVNDVKKLMNEKGPQDQKMTIEKSR